MVMLMINFLIKLNNLLCNINMGQEQSAAKTITFIEDPEDHRVFNCANTPITPKVPLYGVNNLHNLVAEGSILYSFNIVDDIETIFLTQIHDFETFKIKKIISNRALVLIGPDDKVVITLKIKDQWLNYESISERAEIYTHFDGKSQLILESSFLYLVDCKTGTPTLLGKQVQQISVFDRGLAVLQYDGTLHVTRVCECKHETKCDEIYCSTYTRTIKDDILKIFTFDISSKVIVCMNDGSFAKFSRKSEILTCYNYNPNIRGPYDCCVEYDSHYNDERCDHNPRRAMRDFGNILCEIPPNAPKLPGGNYPDIVADVAFHGDKYYVLLENGELYCEQRLMKGLSPITKFKINCENDCSYLVIYDVFGGIFLIGYDGFLRIPPVLPAYNVEYVANTYPKSARNA
jgi:hypothetical protein